MTEPRLEAPWWRTNAAFLLGALAMAALLLPHGAYVPIWDGSIYAECVVHASQQPLWSLGALQCAGHPTLAWALPHALAQRLSPGSTWLLLGVDMAFALLALWSFHRVMARVFPSPEHALGRGLMTLALAVDPTVVGSTLQPNPDIAVYGYFLAAFAALLDGRRRAALAWAFMLVFSKETGALAWAALLLVEALSVTRGDGSLKERLAALRDRVPLLLPLVSLAVFMGVRTRVLNEVSWGDVANNPSSVMHDVLTVSLDDAILHAYIACVMVSSFAWLASASVAVDVGRASALWLFRRPLPAILGSDARARRYLFAVALAEAVVITRYRTFTNPRYFLLLHPLLLATAYAALSRPPAPAALRRIIPGVMAALFLVSCLRTVDPVSRAVFGSFSFGEHAMLNATRISGLCCGMGRDQLVYSLEFSRYESLLNQALEDLRPNARRRVAWSNLADWYLSGRFDARRSRRTLDPHQGEILKPLVVETLLQGPPPPEVSEVFVFQFSNTPAHEATRALSVHYTVAPYRDYVRDGYRLSVLRVTNPH